MLISVTDGWNYLWEEGTINNRTGKPKHERKGNFVQTLYHFIKFSTVFWWQLSSGRPLAQVINSRAHKKLSHILNNRPRPRRGWRPCLNDCSSPERDSLPTAGEMGLIGPIVYLIWGRAFPPFSPAPSPLSRSRCSPLCQFSLSSIFRGRMNLPLLSFLVHFDTRQNSSALRELEQGALVLLWQVLQEPPSISWSIVLERDLSLLNSWLVSKKAVAGVWWYSIIYGGGGRKLEPRAPNGFIRTGVTGRKARCQPLLPDTFYCILNFFAQGWDLARKQRKRPFYFLPSPFSFADSISREMIHK